MKLPIKPYGPAIPIAPKKFIKSHTQVGLDEKNYSLQDILELIPKEVDQKDIVFSCDYYYNQDNDYYGCGYRLSLGYYTISENKKYASELKKYNKDLLAFEIKQKQYEKDLSDYETNLAAYDAWSSSEETSKLEAELTKTLKKAEQLRKKLNK